MPHCSGKKQKSYQQKLDKNGNAYVSQTFNTSGTVADGGTVFNARRLLNRGLSMLRCLLESRLKSFYLKEIKLTNFVCYKFLIW